MKRIFNQNFINFNNNFKVYDINFLSSAPFNSSTRSLFTLTFNNNINKINNNTTYNNNNNLTPISSFSTSSILSLPSPTMPLLLPAPTMPLSLPFPTPINLTDSTDSNNFSYLATTKKKKKKINNKFLIITEILNNLNNKSNMSVINNINFIDDNIITNEVNENNINNIIDNYIIDKNHDKSPKELFKKGESFSKLEFNCNDLNLPSDVHYLNRIARIIYNPDLPLSRRQYYIEECLLNYYNDHFVELVRENPENLKYSELFFKLIHEHYPKFVKLFNVFLKST